MYPSLRNEVADTAGAPLTPLGGASRWPAVSRNVVFLGLTSLFTDISSEMLTAVLPLYFMLELGMTPFQFGVIDGLYQGTSALVRVASGVVADVRGRYKTVAVVGYALSAACKPALLAAGSVWWLLMGLVMIDRLGKGIRTAPRDALITISSHPARLGEAFGVHRALDTVGAAVGPVLAFAMLAAAPGAYDAVFVMSFAVALIGLAVIVLFVENRGAGVDRLPGQGRVTLSQLARPFASPAFRRLVIAGGILGLLTATDALVYLLLQRRSGLSTTLFPLLFVGTACVYFLLALPFGRLADRIGRHRMFLFGHVPVIGVYLTLLGAELSVIGVAVCVALLGAYYAATDGVLSALASSVLPRAQLTTGLAMVATTSGLARLFAATCFGALWTWWDVPGALTAFGVGLSAALLASALLLRVARPWEAAS